MTDQLGLVAVEEAEEAHAVEMVPASVGSIARIMEMVAMQPGSMDTMKALAELQYRAEDRNARKAFVRSLNAFRAECPQPKKTKENEQFKVTRNGVKVNSKYSPLDEIDRTVRPFTSKHGLTWTWDTIIDETHMHVICKIQYEDGHSDSSKVSMPYSSNAGASPQQKYGATQMYGMRYSLVAALGITTADEDLDGADGMMADTISDGQADYLKKLLKDGDANVAKFLEIYKVRSVEEMTVRDFVQACRDIEEPNAAKALREKPADEG